MSRIDFGRPGPWRQLFPHALTLMSHLESRISHPVWSFGGTVIMLRIGHRQSKDIDLFVPDPQYLGFVNPRLSDVAESVSADYEENAEFIKLYLPQGEIDIVVGTPLTDAPFEIATHEGRIIRVETCAEIIAKKMWHRGHHGKARDLFDLCAVAEADPQAIEIARPFMHRHGEAFLAALADRVEIATAEFDAIDTLGYELSFSQAMAIAERLIGTPGP